jgi:hypothetical protein
MTQKMLGRSNAAPTPHSGQMEDSGCRPCLESDFKHVLPYQFPAIVSTFHDSSLDHTSRTLVLWIVWFLGFFCRLIRDPE